MTVCLGAGTLTIPYVFYANGIYFGLFLIFVYASLSLFTGHLIAYCAEKTGGKSYEEVAYVLYGKNGLRFTSFCNICCNIGFLLSYCVLLKTTMPRVLG
jgi:amino acid permease